METTLLASTAELMGHKVREFAEWLNGRRDHDVSAVFHELLGKVCSLLEAAMPASAWLPIESAPRGGELMLLSGEMDGPGDWRIKVGGYWDDKWNIFGGSWTPTRWMPLPAAPGAMQPDLVAWALTGEPVWRASKSTDAEMLQCWSCRRSLTRAQRADADGQCPHCHAEIELEEAGQGSEAQGTAPQFHFWDFTGAKTASVATLQAKARKGWKLFRVSQGFGAAGGTANYEHALVGPARELLKASTRTVEAAGVPEEGVLVLSMQVLLLPGVYKTDLTREASRRGLARAEDLGAQWNGERRSWMVRPEAAGDFAQWIPAGAQPVHMFPSMSAPVVS